MSAKELLRCNHVLIALSEIGYLSHQKRSLWLLTPFLSGCWIPSAPEVDAAPVLSVQKVSVLTDHCASHLPARTTL